MHIEYIKASWILIDKILKQYKSVGEYESCENLKLLLTGFGGVELSDNNLKDLEELYGLFKIVKEIKQLNFVRINDEDSFYFNYRYNNCEMEFDSINVFACEDLAKSIVIDIEDKRSADAFDICNNKSMQQADKKINEHLPRLFKDTCILVVVRCIDSKIQEIIVSNNGVKKEYSLKELNELKYNFSVDKNNNEMLENAFKGNYVSNAIKEIKNKTFKFSDDIETQWKKIHKFINGDKKIMQICGGAGSGKTLLALKCYYNIEKSNLLILNQKFVNTFFSDIETRGNKFITFGSDYFVNKKENCQNVAIIDEAQRMNFQTVEKIAKKYNKIILFGDQKQMYAKDDIDYLNFKKNLIHKFGKNLYESTSLSMPFRFLETTDKILTKLAELDGSSVDEKQKLIRYEINIFLASSTFWNKYETMRNKNRQKTKMYTNYDDIEYKIYDSEYLHIGNNKLLKCGYKNMNFSTSDSEINKVGNPHHAISFDVDNVFIYIPNLKIIEWGGRKYFVFKNIEQFESKEKLNGKYLELIKQHNQVYILLTRATEQVNWLIDDLETYKIILKILKTNLSNWKNNES
jgi:hypothetical protein